MLATVLLHKTLIAFWSLMAMEASHWSNRRLPQPLVRDGVQCIAAVDLLIVDPDEGAAALDA